MGPGNLQECTICMEALDCPVGTNCGHTFCAPCILRWQRQKWPDPCECPVCRRQVGLRCCYNVYEMFSTFSRGINPNVFILKLSTIYFVCCTVRDRATADQFSLSPSKAASNL